MDEEKIKELYGLLESNTYSGLDQKSKLDWVDVIVCFIKTFGIDKVREISGYSNEKSEEMFKANEFSTGKGSIKSEKSPLDDYINLKKAINILRQNHKLSSLNSLYLLFTDQKSIAEGINVKK